jgi:tRNA-Thr(GGU) m(6)t(6)A37 methyltransferase TsaA
MITLVRIGTIHAPFKEPKDAPRQGRGSDTLSVVEIDQAYAPGIGTMEGISYIWILYWMDRADRKTLFARRTDWNEARPVFTTRSPARPNPIALSIGKIESVEGNTITVSGIEALDGSPVLDIKPYVPEIDSVTGEPG